MKVIYEFDPYEDKSELELMQIARCMYSALFDLDSYRRELEKGYKAHDMESILERLNDLLNDSKIRDIP